MGGGVLALGRYTALVSYRDDDPPQRRIFIGVCVSLMVIGHPDDLPHCHTGWEWMCILPDDLHHLHMIFIVA